MSLFDDLIGSTSNANSSNKTTQNQVQQESQVTNTAQTGTTNTSGNQVTRGNQTSTTSSLDPTTIALIGSLLQPLAAQAANPNAGPAGQANQIAQVLQTKAATPAVSASDIAGQESAAKTSFANNEAVDIGRLQQSIGSKNNTYAALVDQKGQTDLASTLAEIVANANLQNAQISTQQLTDAVQALTSGAQIGAAGVSNIAALLQVLKGATTTSGVAETSNTDTSQNVVTAQNQTSDQETQAAASGGSTSSTAGTQGSGLLGLLF